MLNLPPVYLITSELECPGTLSPYLGKTKKNSLAPINFLWQNLFVVHILIVVLLKIYSSGQYVTYNVVIAFAANAAGYMILIHFLMAVIEILKVICNCNFFVFAMCLDILYLQKGKTVRGNVLKWINKYLHYVFVLFYFAFLEIYLKSRNV